MTPWAVYTLRCLPLDKPRVNPNYPDEETVPAPRVRKEIPERRLSGPRTECASDHEEVA